MPNGTARLSLRIDLASGRLGPGKVELLEHIRDRQSLAAAARAMDMSYKRAWELLSAPFGERLIAMYRAVERRAAQAAAAALAELSAASRPAARARRSPPEPKKAARRA